MSTAEVPVTSTPQCRFGDGPATIRVELAQGCVCPEDQVQFLCTQHWVRMEPLGDGVLDVRAVIENLYETGGTKLS